MKIASRISAILISICFSAASQASLDSVEVTGGSIDTGSVLIISPPLINLRTDSLDPTVIELTPSVPGDLSTGLSLAQINNTADAWLGAEYVLDSGGSFNAAPVLTFGDAFEASVSGSANEMASLIVGVPMSGGLFATLDITINGPTKLTITPLVPEPTTALAIPAMLLLGLRKRFG